jgi:hypothetical protein
MTQHPVAHVPASIDFDAITMPDLRCFAKWMTHLVVRRHLTYQLEPDAWVPLTSEFRRRFVPDRKATVVMRDLVAGQVIEARENRQFFPGERKGVAYQYRLTPQHQQSPLIAEPIRSRALLGKLWHYRRESYASITDPIHVALRRWALGAVTVVDGAPQHPVLDAIRGGDPWFVVCPQGRVHTALTSLAREMRQWVRLGGVGDLVAVDISHSQMLLLAVTLSREGLEDAAFLHDCLDAVVYSRFADALGSTRPDAKQRLFALVYGAPARYDRADANVFKRLYPKTWEAVLTLSQHHESGWLSRMMQRVESDLMIHDAAKRFMTDHPDIPLITIHDAFVTSREHADLSAQAVRQSWMDRYRLEPRITTTRW